MSILCDACSKLVDCHEVHTALVLHIDAEGSRRATFHGCSDTCVERLKGEMEKRIGFKFEAGS